MKFNRACLWASVWLGSLCAVAVEPPMTPQAGEISTSEDFFVRWQAGVSPSAIAAHYQRMGVTVVWRSSFVPGLERVVPRDKRRARATWAMNQLAARQDVMYAEPNYQVYRDLSPAMPLETEDGPACANAKPNDPKYDKQWALNGEFGIRAEAAWEMATGSSDIKVAVIDTGLDTQHEDMQGQFTDGYDFLDNTATITDTHGHGTHCCGVIGAATNNGVGMAGINHQVTLIPIRAIPPKGPETDANVIAAFEFAAKNGARVASCSFAKTKSSKAVGDTIEATGKQGLLAVVAAGNDGKDLNGFSQYPACFQTSNMIVVGALSAKGQLSSFSNYGMKKVDIAAPGVGILSAAPKNHYQKMSGSSMATPQVAGVAALVTSVNPSLTPCEVKAILLKAARKLPSLNGKINTGGTLDAAAAVKAAQGR